MNIIDHIYIGVLSSPLLTAILDILASFTQHQLTQHHDNYPPASLTKISPIMTVYHDKAKTEPLFKHILLLIDMLTNANF